MVGQLRPRQRWGEDEDEKEMKMKWAWRWCESCVTGTRGRERKKRAERENTQHAQPRPTGEEPTVKGQGKRKANGRRKGNQNGGGGRTEAPESTYDSETYAYLGMLCNIPWLSATSQCQGSSQQKNHAKDTMFIHFSSSTRCFWSKYVVCRRLLAGNSCGRFTTNPQLGDPTCHCIIRPMVPISFNSSWPEVPGATQP